MLVHLRPANNSFVSVPFHCLIAGETTLTKNDKNYPLIARLNYLMKYSSQARKTFLNCFEGNGANSTSFSLEPVAQRQGMVSGTLALL